MANLSELNNFPYWLLSKAPWIFGFVALLFGVTAYFVGSSNAWEILVGRTTPKNASYPWCSWPLSVVGWLVVPAFIGAIAGYAVNKDIENRRTKTGQQVSDALGKGATPGDHH